MLGAVAIIEGNFSAKTKKNKRVLEREEDDVHVLFAKIRTMW